MTLRVRSLDELPEQLRTDDVRRQLAGAAAPAPTGYQPAPRAVQQARESVPAVGASAGSLKPRKYRNEPTAVDGIRFDSKLEASRYATLRALEAAGQLSNLRLQPRYALHALGGGFVGEYVADFEYLDHRGKLTVEDVKSGPTARKELYRWKKAHFECEYGLEVHEHHRRPRKRKATP